jgi:hypothetical protein
MTTLNIVLRTFKKMKTDKNIQWTESPQHAFAKWPKSLPQVALAPMPVSNFYSRMGGATKVMMMATRITALSPSSLSILNRPQKME